MNGNPGPSRNLAERSRVELHDQTVVDRHASHLDEHVRLETALIVLRRVSAQGALEDRLDLLDIFFD